MSEKDKDEKKDPLIEQPVFEPRHLTSPQRLAMKNFISQLIEKRSGWLIDQRSIVFEGPTDDDSWTSLKKNKEVQRQFLQVVIRPEVKSGKTRGLLLYHRYVNRNDDYAVDRRGENRRLEDDGVVKLLNQHDDKLSTPWVATAWRDSKMAKQLNELFKEITARNSEEINKNEVKRNTKIKRVKRTPF